MPAQRGVLLAVVLGLCAPAPATPAAPPSVGRFENGVAYAILSNKGPGKDVAFRLGVRAGSVMEDDDQRGLAHLLEHLVFRGTPGFPRDIPGRMEQLGARFGPDLNATTDYDRTIYKIDVPAQPDSAIRVALQLLSELAGKALLREEDLALERGVVIEERRLGLTAKQRIWDAHAEALYHGSARASRRVIGSLEVIEGAPLDRLTDFYRDWYRPDRMVVVVAGDVDTTVILQALRTTFAALPAAGPPRAVPDETIPHDPETEISVAADEKASRTSLGIGYRRPYVPGREGTLRAALRRAVFERYLALNLFADQRGSGGQVTVSTRRVGPNTLLLLLDGTVREGRELDAVRDVLLEVERLAQQKPLLSRLEESRAFVLSALRHRYANRLALSNSELAESWIPHLLEGDERPDLERDYREGPGLLEGIEPAEIDSLLKDLVRGDDRIVMLDGPDRAKLPQVQALGEVLADVASTQVKAREAWPAERRILAHEKTPGSIVARREIDSLGVTVLTLSNGAEVWLKPLHDRPDEILFGASAPGGRSLAGNKHLIEAIYAPQITAYATVGGFLAPGLGRLLGDRRVSGRIYVGMICHGLSGTTTPSDLETALQLIHATFADLPDQDLAVTPVYLENYAAWRSATMRRLELDADDPERAVAGTTEALASNDNEFFRPPGRDAWARMSFIEGTRFYRKCFSNVADFRFTFTGAFEADELTRLIEKYLASIPATGPRNSPAMGRSVSFPDRLKRATVRAGLEPRGLVALTFYTPTGLDPLATEYVGLASRVVRMRLIDVLRGERGDAYEVTVRSMNLAPMSDYGTTTIQFGCSPELADSLAARALHEIDALRSSTPDSTYLGRLQRTGRRELEDEDRDNGTWAEDLRAMSLGGADRLPPRRKALETFDSRMLRAVLDRYFSTDRCTQVISQPRR